LIDLNQFPHLPKSGRDVGLLSLFLNPRRIARAAIVIKASTLLLFHNALELKWDAFFARYPKLFDWQRPDGSCMAFPRYKGSEGVEAFCRSLVEQSGILFLPSTIYSSELGPTPTDRFRLGFGRKGLDKGLTALDAHMQRYDEYTGD